MAAGLARDGDSVLGCQALTLRRQVYEFFVQCAPIAVVTQSRSVDCARRFSKRGCGTASRRVLSHRYGVRPTSSFNMHAERYLSTVVSGMGARLTTGGHPRRRIIASGGCRNWNRMFGATIAMTLSLVALVGGFCGSGSMRMLTKP